MKFQTKNIIKGIVLILVVAIVSYLLMRFVDFSNIGNIEYLKDKILSFGMLSPLIYILFMAIAIIVSPIPSMPLAAASGMIWGPYLGTFYSVIGAEIGAIVSFLIARYIGRDLIEKILHKDIKFCDRCDSKTAVWIIFVARLFPFFQFDIISYGAGLTNIKLKYFAIATFFGMIPIAFLLAYFGQSIFVNTLLSFILGGVIILLMFIVPILIKKYNLFNLKNKI